MQSNSDQPPTENRLRIGGYWLPLLLGLHGALLVTQAVRTSAGADEGAHVAAGLAYWRFHETSIYDLSPPLLRYVAALPAYLAGAKVPVAAPLQDIPASSRHWTYFNDVQDLNAGHVHRYVLWGRLMLIPLSLATAVVIFAWSSRLFGRLGGLVSCGGWCLSPLVIAQGSRVGTDVGCTLGMVLTVWCWDRFERSNKPIAALACSFAFAFALTTKFTALLLIPLLIVLAGRSIWIRRLKIRDVATALALCAAIGFVEFNVAYGFRRIGYPVDWWSFKSGLMNSLQAHLPARWPVPFSRDAVEGFDAQKAEAQWQFPSVLFGRGYFGSDWRFYPMQLTLHETLGLLALIALLLASFARLRLRPEEWPICIALLFMILAFCMLVNINVSLRYLLPVYPFLAIMIGRLVLITGLRRLALIALAATLSETILHVPHLNGFSNCVAARLPYSAQGLADGSGGLIDVRRWLDAHRARHAAILCGGTIRPSEYGLPAEGDMSDVLIVEKEFLSGLPIRTADGFVFLRCWRELRELRPIDDLGPAAVYSMDQVRATQVEPWKSIVKNWQQVWDDPKALPFDRTTIPITGER